MADRAERGGGRATPIDPFQIKFTGYGRMDTGIVQGTGADWFGPLNPMAPTAPPEVAGRIFDFPSGYNLNQVARAYEPIGFPELRALGDAYDVLRLIIETRKDQMSALDWNVQPRDPERAKKSKRKEDARQRKIEDFILRPDRVHYWDTWLRMLLEDMFVLDAATCWVRRTRGGELYGLEPLDGATIKRVIDDWGRTPDPPTPAYQQILKGFPAVDYTADEIIYAPRNVRTNKVYGYSPVEQIIVTVNIALRRQIFQLQYYTEGNIPEALIGVPETWTPGQIADFQAWWDSVLEGNTAQRRHAKFVPGGVAKTFVPTKQEDQKQMYDEWLARICCFCFSISAEPFVAMMNRATAETSQTRSLKEGLAPTKLWVKQFVDDVITRLFDAPDLEFRWRDEAEPDPLQQKDILTGYVAGGILSRDEARESLGRDPIPGGDIVTVDTGAGPIPVEDIGIPIEPLGGDGFGGAPGGAGEDDPENVPGKDGGDDDEEVGKSAAGPFAKSARALRPVPVRTRLMHVTRRRLRRSISRSLRNLVENTAVQIERAIEQRRRDGRLVLKAAPTPEEIQARAIEAAQQAIDEALRQAEAEAIAAGLDFGEWRVLIQPTEVALEAIAKDVSVRMIQQISVGAPADYLVTQVHEKAAEYARARAAEMVGMRRMANGDLVQNPHAKWAITQGTRDELRGIITEAIDPGLEPDELREAIKDSGAFSDQRADLIARTELARAHSEGNLIGMKESAEVVGPFKKKWLTAGDARVSPECRANQAQGPIPLDAHFSSGDDTPPAHPRCRCVLVPVLDDDQPNQGA